MRRKATSMGQPHKPLALRGALALRARAGQAPRPGFTLIEIVVAVGAVALVAVGLASIFDTVGKTVTGGRRVSVLNTYAGLLERQMRADFDAMSRDGFLVIRQQWVDVDGDGKYTPGADRVPVSGDDVAPRGRRIDEILFFVNGHFASERQSTWPGVQATSGTAMVYYGHGQTTRPRPVAGVYTKPVPNVSDRNGDVTLMLGMPPAVGQPADSNPNYYAGNWTLLRRQTLLSKPGSTESVTTAAPFGLNPTRAPERAAMEDQATQVGLQPAASSIFRSIASVYPGSVPPPTNLRVMAGLGFDRPFLGSGVVDVAATDLNEIRMIVTSGAAFPGPAVIRPDGITTPNQLPLLSFRIFDPSWETAIDAYRGGRPTPGNYLALDRMQAWMSDAFPTDSRNGTLAPTINDFPADASATGSDVGALGTRVRYEPQSTDLMAALQTAVDPSGTAIPQPPTRAAKIKIVEARGDQLLLGSANLVPHCSEFIVEWSFGDLDPTGDVVWHGPQRQVGAGMVRPYPWDAQNFERLKQVPIAGTFVNPQTGAQAALPNQFISDRLIYGYSPVHDGTPGEACLTSYFGWTDPTYAPPVPANNVQVGGNATWPWPRMIRVTITLSDPLEPTIESTFQYVFTTPADPK